MFSLEGHIERDYINQVLTYTYVYIVFLCIAINDHLPKVAGAPMMHKPFWQTWIWLLW